MNQFQIKVKGLYVTKYKVVKPNQYVLNLNEDVELAGRFDEDDFVLELCQKMEIIACGFRDTLGTLSLTDEKLISSGESLPEEFNWL